MLLKHEQVHEQELSLEQQSCLRAGTWPQTAMIFSSNKLFSSIIMLSSRNLFSSSNHVLEQQTVVEHHYASRAETSSRAGNCLEHLLLLEHQKVSSSNICSSRNKASSIKHFIEQLIDFEQVTVVEHQQGLEFYRSSMSLFSSSNHVVEQKHLLEHHYASRAQSSPSSMSIGLSDP